MRVLLIEDDPIIGQAIESSFSKEAAHVVWATDATTAEDALDTGSFDLLVLDLGLPDKSGLTLLKGLRVSGNATPVLILSARDGVEDRIAGLDHGADDYMVKPFDTGELKARCRALVRRAQGHGHDILSLHELTIDRGAMTVMLGAQEVVLRKKEYQILVYLAERQGKVVPKSDLIDMLYGWEDGAESNTVEVYVSTLRRRIGADRIRTLRGVGYMMP